MGRARRAVRPADTLTSGDNLAMVLAARGDHAAAEAEYRDVLAAKLRVLGPDHPDTLTTRHNLGHLFAQ